MTEVSPSLLILAQGASWEQRFQVSSLASSEAAAGRAVDIALFFGALDSWVNRDWDLIDPTPPIDRERLQSLALPPLSELFGPGREAGLLRLFACSASVRILGLEAADVQARVDAILGWQSFSRMIDRAPSVVTF
jgi:peroxiredoxin family protein